MGLPNIQMVAVDAGPGDDRLTGPNQVNTWKILGPNAGKLDDKISFFEIENLTGGATKDTFTISNAASLTGKIDGAGGQKDSLNYQLWNQPVSFDLANLTATGLGSFAGIESFVGGSAFDTLKAPDAPNFWTIKGTNAGEINTLFFGVLAFNSIENLVGGASTDMYLVAPPGHLSGSITDSAGTNTLGYSSWTADVTVNLPLGQAQAIDAGTVGIGNVTGGGGNDILIGDGAANVLKGQDGHDILVGGDGSDTLLGGAGRDLLIGGLGADLLDVGSGDDLLVGGYTAYDHGISSLLAIRTEWTRTDLQGTAQQVYEQRIDHLRNGTGLNGNNVKLIDGVSVFGDQVTDTLTGGTNLDWFWANLTEITDLQQGQEQVN